MNKNQQRVRESIRVARKAGNNDVAFEVPSHGYHNSPKGAWQVRRIAPLVAAGFKKKAKNFPSVGEPMTLINQIKMFYGACCTLS